MNSKTFLISIFFLAHYSFLSPLSADSAVTIIDEQHYSQVFGEMRSYRVFLPPNYDRNGEKKYPVIYFLHGWSQRYFGSGPDPYSEYDQQEDNQGDNIEKFVSQHEVIVVKSDGYNRGKNEDYYLRPYNVGPVETHRQFPIYYEELINHIDRKYPTRSDREHRAITGLSMGGFMSFFIAAKYPHLFSAAGSFCGSPEFVIGPREMPVEYRHLDMYRNYDGLNVRLHYGDQDFIRGYHADLNRVWPYTMDNYSFKIFPGDEHTTSGLGEMFEFLFSTFENPPKKPARWTHADIYPEFTVWDYQVYSDRTRSGLTLIENVDKQGFKISVREFLPNGATMPQVNITVLTGPIYEKNRIYTVVDYDVHRNSSTQKQVASDDFGRIKISTNGGTHHIGINKIANDPNIVLLEPIIENVAWAVTQKDVALSLTLVNRGLTESGPLKGTLSADSDVVTFTRRESTFPIIDINQRQQCVSPFSFQVNDADAEKVRLKLEISNDKKSWVEYFELELKKEVEAIQQFQIADGGTFVVAKGGDEKDTLLIGRGNGDGIPNPGESIEILILDRDIYHRTLVTGNAPCINPNGSNIRHSDYWGRYDNVGGSAKYSVLSLSSPCSNQPIPLFVEYWLPDKPLHIIKQGKVSISIEGQDKTPPEIMWSEVTGKNLLQVKVHDGSSIRQVTATFSGEDGKSFLVGLNDAGSEGDRVSDDGVFTALCPPQQFGFYGLTLDIIDSYGNEAREKISKPFLLHH